MRPEVLLGSGLITLAIAGALVQFVLVGLLGMILLPVGFLLLTFGMLAARVPSVPPQQARRGAITGFLGVLLITAAAFKAGSLAYATAIHRIHAGSVESGSAPADWLLGLGLAVLAAVFIGLGLRLRADWPPVRALRWSLASLAVFPGAVALFFLLALWQPYSA